MKRLYLSLQLALFLLPSIAYLNPARSAVRASSSSVVISEFRTRGPNGGNDEFIELYNGSSSPVAIGGWEVKGGKFIAPGQTVTVQVRKSDGTLSNEFSFTRPTG